MNKHQVAAKKYLSQAFGLNQRIESKLGQIEELHDLATKATVTYGYAEESEQWTFPFGRCGNQDHRT